MWYNAIRNDNYKSIRRNEDLPWKLWKNLMVLEEKDDEQQRWMNEKAGDKKGIRFPENDK